MPVGGWGGGSAKVEGGGGAKVDAAAELDYCSAFCLEGVPSSHERSAYVHVGDYSGSYVQASSVEWVGEGRGNLEKVTRAEYTVWRCKACSWALLCIGLFAALGLLLWWRLAWRTPAQDEIVPPAPEFDCYTGYHDWTNVWGEAQQKYCCGRYGRACQPHYEPPRVIYQHVPVYTQPHTQIVHVPVPAPAHTQVVYHTRYIHDHAPQRQYNCRAGYSNWYFGWSRHKKVWCCHNANRGCPGTWHGSYHLHMHVMHGVGHAHGRIYDCAAGFSNWMQGWSDSKKDWCCSHEHKGCVKYHCNGHAGQWDTAKSAWCCAHFQKGCPQTTLSPLKCETPCEIQGETETCMNRIKWTKDNVFGDKDNKCALAYSKVQVECDVCRSCSIQDAGCGTPQGAGSLPFDCEAAINNFFRAWSPEKKHWCCTKQGKGCEGQSPPSVDAGYGMVWKHVQVNGYWTWVAVHGHGHFSMPYDCHAGLANWHTGWSAGKKGWCCSHQHLGCAPPGGAGGGGGGGGGSVHVIHVIHHGGGGGGGGGYHNHAHPPFAAGNGQMWHWSMAGGGHWVQVGMQGHLPFDCLAGVSNWRAGWSQPKKDFCCHNFGNSCA